MLLERKTKIVCCICYAGRWRVDQHAHRDVGAVDEACVGLSYVVVVVRVGMASGTPPAPPLRAAC